MELDISGKQVHGKLAANTIVADTKALVCGNLEPACGTMALACTLGHHYRPDRKGLMQPTDMQQGPRRPRKVPVDSAYVRD